MKKQLHQRVDTDYVKHILGKHLSQGFPVEECIRSLKVSRSRFYELSSLYRETNFMLPKHFFIFYRQFWEQKCLGVIKLFIFAPILTAK